ncbi:hypothetical protein STAS_02693 [Striga asiatica]|uniref:DUF7733 domain-containing protein n=1 Tax=Striga asiatica TaxID=4170 RepID=A0A5A7P2G0_STRAF|nr:hypothetical protein STAS_02693 [Striga asiatica]
MSGGVGPPSDIPIQPDAPHPSAGGGRSFLTLRLLNALAVAVVLSASGMVTVQDVAFVVFSVFYFYFISRVAFPLAGSDRDPPVFGGRGALLTAYSLVGYVVGLFLPAAYICEGVYEGDREGIKAAAPHVFLLASQIFMEGVAAAAEFSLPVRVLVPVVYNSMRVLSVVEWLRNEISKAEAGSVRRLAVGRGLAAANLAYWGFNLFGFLLPVYMPKAFKAYYSKIKD